MYSPTNAGEELVERRGGLQTVDETTAQVNPPDQHNYFVFINKIEKYMTYHKYMTYIDVI